MNRLSIFKWTCLATASVTLVLILTGLKNQASVSAASTKSGSSGQGSLLAVDKGGKLLGACPLKHTSVKAEVTGFLSRVTVTQEFENSFEENIEAVYTFPLPQRAAVDDMTMIVGGRTIRGKIMRRAEATAAYEAARSRGQTASLLDQERPNIFTQSVANIMPGQPVRVRISYVEHLKYEDGTYEFVFPMVVGPRYIPAKTDDKAEGAGDVGSAQQAAAQGEPSPERTAADSSSTSARIQPPVAPVGTRAGHDISLEVTLDAGVPIDKLESRTHEIVVENRNATSTVVRLKEEDNIPNRDFVLRYDVAGRRIEDALLAHRGGRGGFFTLILQPPERATVEDVTPKELVFVLDTSGSMGGFPLEKARETINLALDGLYPQDTFNLITFSGDTEILFKRPVAATSENLKRAKKFLDGRKSDGGTEMMKAIRAALKPSDAEDHLRVVCFMTDGQVGDDVEILAEVQKYSNARVFAMGFGDAPNRFLLDKMAEYGRGEVEYVSERDDGSLAARRFFERVRSPLLTDISVEWAGLPIEDVYPKRIPDLFSAGPVILSGRYHAPARGTIRLKGKMSGREFTREIAVELPETKTQHDVLATLWARKRIDQLTTELTGGEQSGESSDKLREAITVLGLQYSLMTEYTSFVAVEDSVVNPPGEPRRVEVPVEATQNAVTVMNGAGPSPNMSAINATVTVVGSSSSINSTDIQLSTTIEQNAIAGLPVRGRSLQSLVTLSPGTVQTGSTQIGSTNAGQISVSGQRTTSNTLMIDGVSANVGIGPGQNPVQAAGGALPALTASGGTNNLVSVDAVSEVTIRTFNYGAEYGRTSGGQFSVVTRSGTNEFHGKLFESFGTDALDANDWFANSLGLKRAERRLNNFGGSFGGPIKRDQSFFFFSYEGLRLRQPMFALTDVPSVEARAEASPALQPYLNAYPVPTGATRADGFAPFAATYSVPVGMDAASLRVDRVVNDRLTVFGRYNFSVSRAEERALGGFSLNTLSPLRNSTQTLTAVATYVFSPTVAGDLRFNYSRAEEQGSYRLDDFGGAVLPPAEIFFPAASTNPDASFAFDLNGRNAALGIGSELRNVQRQFNLVGSINWVKGTHTFKFGADYRRLSPTTGARAFEQRALFTNLDEAISGLASRQNFYARTGPQRPVFLNLSFYGQDDWRITPRLTLAGGVRWDINSAPRERTGADAFALTQSYDLTRLNLAPRGTPLWETTYLNLAPRVGLNYQLSQASGREFVLRAGFGLVFDTASDQAGAAYVDSFPFLATEILYDAPFTGARAFTPASNADAPVSAPLQAFDPRLKLPYTLQWSFGAERALGSNQSVSVTYLGAAGRRGLLTRTLIDPSPGFSFVRLTTNEARSDYRALELQYNRRLSRGLQAFISYTWSKSLDNNLQDSLSRTLLRSDDPSADRGPSDFDVRHLLNGTLTYALPSPFDFGIKDALARNWTISTNVYARSARPVSVVYGVLTDFGFAYLRPDVIDGVPVYLTDATSGGARRINPNAFAIPASQKQGTFQRNSLRGFPLYQMDLALLRVFNFTERWKLHLKAEAINLFNHPNFEDPSGTDTSLGIQRFDTNAFITNQTFGRSASLYGRNLWGAQAASFNSFYNVGGPRTFQFTVKLEF